MSALPYEVRHGYCNQNKVAFAEFALALAFLRGLVAGQEQGRDARRLHPELVNVDNIDGADDASRAAQRGLTEDELAAVEEVF